MFLRSVSPQGLYVRADSKIKTIYDLEGGAVSPGYSGSSTEKDAKRVIEDIAGIHPKWVYGSLNKLVDMVKSRRLEGFFKGGERDAAILSLNAEVPLRLIPMPSDIIAKANQLHPGWLMEVDIEAENYPFLDQDTTVFGLVFAINCTTRLDEGITYKLSKAINENCKELGKVYKPVGTALEKWGDMAHSTIALSKHNKVPLHPGTYRYFKEIGIDVPSNLVPK